MHALPPQPSAPVLAGPWADLDDEQLVELARQPGGAPAQDELLRRCGPANTRLVGRLAARFGLQEADCLDVQQEAVFWTIEAIFHYRADPDPATRGCRFRSFVYHVVTVRFIDYVRRQRRRERPIGLGTREVDAAAGALDGLEFDDVRACVDRELDRLGPVARPLWGLLVQGVSLRRAAADLGISYDMAKRQRRDLFARLRVALAG